MVGNGATDYILDVWPAYVPTLYNFQMIPKSLYDTFNANNCFFSFNDVLQDQPSQICIDTFNEINAMTTDHVNWYDLYRPVYPEALKRMKSEPRYGEVEINGEIKKYKRGKTIKEYTPWVKGANEDIILGMTLSDYINQQEVRTALNIDPKLTDPFELCSSKLKYFSEPEASKWIYKVLKNKIKMMFYSGDTDGALPTAGTKNWIESLKWKKVADTR